MASMNHFIEFAPPTIISMHMRIIMCTMCGQVSFERQFLELAVESTCSLQILIIECAVWVSVLVS